MNWFEKLRLDLDLWWIRFIIRYNLNKSAKIRRKYCANGWHKLHRIQWSFSGWKDDKPIRKVSMEFLKCKYCNYKFFATKKQREKYHILAEKELSERSATFIKLLSSSAERNGDKK